MVSHLEYHIRNSPCESERARYLLVTDATLVEPATATRPGSTWTLLFQSESEVRQYAFATALAKYGALAGPGQVGPQGIHGHRLQR